jgi:hypothetical protein
MLSSPIEVRDDAEWVIFLTGAALATGIAVVGLVLTFMLALGMDPSAPPDYAELVQASRRLVAFRIVAVLDIMVWLGIGATLLTLGGILMRDAPIRAALIGACGLGQLLAATGGYTRLVGVTELASRYATAGGDEQTRIIAIYLALAVSIMSHYGLAQLLSGVGFLMVSVLAMAHLGLPRWLAVWLGLIGAYAVINQLVAAAGIPLDLGPLFLIYLVLGLGGAHLSLGLVAWQRTLRGTLGLAAATAPSHP